MATALGGLFAIGGGVFSYVSYAKSPALAAGDLLMLDDPGDVVIVRSGKHVLAASANKPLGLDGHRSQGAMPMVDQHAPVCGPNPGLPPAAYAPPAPALIRERIAAVSEGSSTEVGAESSQPIIGGGPRAIQTAGDHVVVRIDQPSAGLYLDPALAGADQVTMDLRTGGTCLVEMPLSGPGTLVDGIYVPPGGTAEVGTGSQIALPQAMGIHLRPIAVPPKVGGPG